MEYIRVGSAIVIVIILIVFLILYYYSIFEKIEIREKEKEKMILIGNMYVGNYKNTAKIQDKIYDILLANNIETYKGFAIYYDDPKEVSTNQLRSFSGCILEEKDYNKIEEIKKLNFEIKEIPRQTFIMTEFRYRNPFSVIIGIFKVYPKLNNYIIEKKYAKTEIMEVYDIPNKKILYFIRREKN